MGERHEREIHDVLHLSDAGTAERTRTERSLPWLCAVAAVTVASGLLGGFVLGGLASVAASIALGVLSFFVGLRAVTRAVERTRF